MKILFVFSAVTLLLILNDYERYINSEARNSCSCFKLYKKGYKAKERERNIISYEKNFGGDYFDFDKCLQQKRTKEEVAFINSLTIKQKEEFTTKVYKRMERTCPSTFKWLQTIE